MHAADIFSLLVWTWDYHNTLIKFGVRDDEVENGYIVLCEAYSLRISL